MSQPQFPGMYPQQSQAHNGGVVPHSFGGMQGNQASAPQQHGMLPPSPAPAAAKPSAMLAALKARSPLTAKAGHMSSSSPSQPGAMPGRGLPSTAGSLQAGQPVVMTAPGAIPLSALQPRTGTGCKAVVAQAVSLSGSDSAPTVSEATSGTVCKTKFIPRRPQPADPSAGKTGCRAQGRLVSRAGSLVAVAIEATGASAAATSGAGAGASSEGEHPHQYVRVAEASTAVSAKHSSLLQECRGGPRIEDLCLSPPLKGVRPATAARCFVGHKAGNEAACLQLLAVSAGRMGEGSGIRIRVFAVAPTRTHAAPAARQILAFRLGTGAAAAEDDGGSGGGRGSKLGRATGGTGGPEEDDDESEPLDEAGDAQVPLSMRGAARVHWMTSAGHAAGLPRAMLAVATAAGVLLVHVDGRMAAAPRAQVPHPVRIDPSLGAEFRSGDVAVTFPEQGGSAAGAAPWRFLPFPPMPKVTAEAASVGVPVAMSLASSACSPGCNRMGAVDPLLSGLHLLAVARTAVLCLPPAGGAAHGSGTEIAFMSETHVLNVGAAPRGTEPLALPPLDKVPASVPSLPVARWVMASGSPTGAASHLREAVESLRAAATGTDPSAAAEPMADAARRLSEWVRDSQPLTLHQGAAGLAFVTPASSGTAGGARPQPATLALGLGNNETALLVIVVPPKLDNPEPEACLAVPGSVVVVGSPAREQPGSDQSDRSYAMSAQTASRAGQPGVLLLAGGRRGAAGQQTVVQLQVCALPKLIGGGGGVGEQREGEEHAGMAAVQRVARIDPQASGDLICAAPAEPAAPSGDVAVLSAGACRLTRVRHLVPSDSESEEAAGGGAGTGGSDADATGGSSAVHGVQVLESVGEVLDLDSAAGAGVAEGAPEAAGAAGAEAGSARGDQVEPDEDEDGDGDEGQDEGQDDAEHSSHQDGSESQQQLTPSRKAPTDTALSPSALLKHSSHGNTGTGPSDPARAPGGPSSGAGASEKPKRKAAPGGSTGLDQGSESRAAQARGLREEEEEEEGEGEGGDEAGGPQGTHGSSAPTQMQRSASSASVASEQQLTAVRESMLDVLPGQLSAMEMRVTATVARQQEQASARVRTMMQALGKAVVGLNQQQKAIADQMKRMEAAIGEMAKAGVGAGAGAGQAGAGASAQGHIVSTDAIQAAVRDVVPQAVATGLAAGTDGGKAVAQAARMGALAAGAEREPEAAAAAEEGARRGAEEAVRGAALDMFRKVVEEQLVPGLGGAAAEMSKQASAAIQRAAQEAGKKLKQSAAQAAGNLKSAGSTAQDRVSAGVRGAEGRLEQASREGVAAIQRAAEEACEAIRRAGLDAARAVASAAGGVTSEAGSGPAAAAATGGASASSGDGSGDGAGDGAAAAVGRLGQSDSDVAELGLSSLMESLQLFPGSESIDAALLGRMQSVGRVAAEGRLQGGAGSGAGAEVDAAVMDLLEVGSAIATAAGVAAALASAAQARRSSGANVADAGAFLGEVSRSVASALKPLGALCLVQHLTSALQGINASDEWAAATAARRAQWLVGLGSMQVAALDAMPHVGDQSELDEHVVAVRGAAREQGAGLGELSRAVSGALHGGAGGSLGQAAKALAARMAAASEH